eukprot:366119-Chlamydomonas_euryale.AAC.17
MREPSQLNCGAIMAERKGGVVYRNAVGWRASAFAPLGCQSLLRQKCLQLASIALHKCIPLCKHVGEGCGSAAGLKTHYNLPVSPY